MAKVIAIGSPVVDYLTFVRTLDFPKGGMIATSYEDFKSLYKNYKWTLCSGGSSTNTLKGLHHLGHDCTIIGKIGLDEAAKYFIRHTHELGLKTELIYSETPSTQALVFITPEGERTFRTFLGAGAELKPTDLSAAWFKDAQLLHMEGYIFNAEAVAEKAASHVSSNTLISLDLSSYETVIAHHKRLIPFITDHVDILFANRLEAYELTHDNPEKSAKLLQDLAPVIIITDTDKGCYVGSGGKVIHVPVYPINPLDTTGAGDIFASGFLHGKLKGRNLEDCAQMGHRLAREVIQVIGTELPPPTWRTLQNMGFF